MKLHLSAGTVIADRFRLVRRLSRGGMGAVWLAHHTRLDMPCAVKFTHEEDATALVMQSRFEREAQIAAQLRSPNVVQILDYGTCQGVPYIAMEYLEGEDLNARLRRVRTLEPKETASIVSQIARALNKAHAAGLVHRDLKPANIFLVRDDEHEIAKVLDFGIAKKTLPGVSDVNTANGSIMGTPHFLSPEQAMGTKAVDHRADIWALGVIVFRCITGHLPFPSEAIGDLLLQIMIQPIPMPSHFVSVPPGFDAWWRRAAARDPDQRFQSAKELADALFLALDLPNPGIDSSMSLRPGLLSSSSAMAMISSVHDGVMLPKAAPVGRTPSAVSFDEPRVPPKRSRHILIPAALGCLLCGGSLAFVALRAPSADDIVPSVQGVDGPVVFATSSVVESAAVLPTAAAVLPTAAAVLPTAAAVPPTATASEPERAPSASFIESPPSSSAKSTPSASARSVPAAAKPVHMPRLPPAKAPGHPRSSPGSTSQGPKKTSRPDFGI